MARPAKVWHRSDIGWWMVTLGGVKTRLVQGPNDEQHRILAEEKFVELRKLQRVAPQAPTARTADVIEAFLQWSRQHLSAETHRVNQLGVTQLGFRLARFESVGYNRRA